MLTTNLYKKFKPQRKRETKTKTKSWIKKVKLHVHSAPFLPFTRNKNLNQCKSSINQSKEP